MGSVTQILGKEDNIVIKSKKLIKSICFVLVLLFTLASASVTSWADDGIDGSSDMSTGDSPMYTNIGTTSSGISISGITATCTAAMTAHGSMSLKIKMELQKKKSGEYQTIETWTASRTGVSIADEQSRVINVLSTYRLKVTFTAGSESVTYYRYP